MDQGAFGWRRMLGMQQPQPNMDAMRQQMGGAITEAELQRMMSGAGPAATGGAFGNPMAGRSDTMAQMREQMGGAVTEAELQRMYQAQQQPNWLQRMFGR